MNSTLVKPVRTRGRRRKVPERGSAVAAHTTCYEQKAKVMGLKAANAFWNPFYYHPLRRTLTKPLLHLSDGQLLQELRALLYLAVASNRSLILPNVLGDRWTLGDGHYSDLFLDRALWPGFRTVHLADHLLPHSLSILEPSFYWRMARDFSDVHGASVPEAKVLSLAGGGRKRLALRQVENELLALHDHTRVVLHVYSSADGSGEDRTIREEKIKKAAERVAQWSADSVGSYGQFESERSTYAELPKLDYRRSHNKHVRYTDIARSIVQNSRLCDNFFVPDQGNRSCFNKCK
mmetsp:Transcript_22413/g.30684  ORF Transcript_22413/g.30684 Transcript_22413/m.30684 type:complete len:292 (+) Transcript_22413:734-1609(+)